MVRGMSKKFGKYRVVCVMFGVEFVQWFVLGDRLNRESSLTRILRYTIKEVNMYRF